MTLQRRLTFRYRATPTVPLTGSSISAQMRTSSRPRSPNRPARPRPHCRQSRPASRSARTRLAGPGHRRSLLLSGVTAVAFPIHRSQTRHPWRQTMKTALLQVLLSIALILGSVSVAAAQWTTVGSAGTVDEADVAEFETAGSQVRILDTAALPASVVIRYNVVAVNGVSGGNRVGMGARYRDNGNGARVLTVLRRVNLMTGVTTPMLTIDSNAFPTSSTFQVQSVAACALFFDFSSNAYFVETTLTKSSAAANPA